MWNYRRNIDGMNDPSIAKALVAARQGELRASARNRSTRSLIAQLVSWIRTKRVARVVRGPMITPTWPPRQSPHHFDRAAHGES